CSSSHPIPSLHSFPTRRSSDLIEQLFEAALKIEKPIHLAVVCGKNEALKKRLQSLSPNPKSEIPNPKSHTTTILGFGISDFGFRSEEHTSELQSLRHLVCRLLL